MDLEQEKKNYETIQKGSSRIGSLQARSFSFIREEEETESEGGAPELKEMGSVPIKDVRMMKCERNIKLNRMRKRMYYLDGGIISEIGSI